MIETISFKQLLISFIPVVFVIFLMWRWQLQAGNAIYALFRMLAQLLLIGYVLVFIFDSNSSLIISAVLFVMIMTSSWIALNTSKTKTFRLFIISLFAILFGGGFTLALITAGVLQLDPWHKAHYIIPLAGMIFANSMNSVSLSAERLEAEIQNGTAYERARIIAFQTAMIPVINSLFAVGLVSLPGMMTGQILSGVSPFIAARYQIMVMCMIFSSAGFSTACFLFLREKWLETESVS